MNLDDFNKWLTLIANVGVLTGIIFLAIELQQNTNMMQAQTRDSVTKNTLDYISIILSSPENTRALARMGFNAGQAADDPDNLETLVFALEVQANFRIWENEWYQYQSGLFGFEEIEARQNTWKYTLQRAPGFLTHWENRKLSYSPSFRLEIDRIIKDIQLSESL